VWISRAPASALASARSSARWRPDICVFDLDPSRDEPEELRKVTLALRDLLDELGLPSWVKTSGSKGYHIVVPLDGKSGYGDVARFAGAVGACSSRRSTSHARVQQEGSRRPHLRGHRAQRLARRSPPSMPFARAGARSAPCTWEEIERGHAAADIHAANDGRSRGEVGDLWSDMRHARGRSLQQGRSEKLRKQTKVAPT
jgi:bifunctional non-homologous end joining protein LigD